MNTGDATAFLKVLDKCQSNMPKAMAEASRDVASEWVDKAKSFAKQPQQSKAAQSLVKGTTPDGGAITSSLPWFFGAEFGGGGRPSTNQFPPYQGKRGYFLYPAARANKAGFEKIWTAGVDESMKAWGK